MSLATWSYMCICGEVKSVTYMSPVRHLLNHLWPGSKIFDWHKLCLITIYRLRSDCSHVFLILWFSQFGGYLDLLIGSSKGLWLLDSVLILVANASTQDILVATPWISVVLPTPILPTSNQLLPFHLHSQISVTTTDKLVNQPWFSFPVHWEEQLACEMIRFFSP